MTTRDKLVVPILVLDVCVCVCVCACVRAHRQHPSCPLLPECLQKNQWLKWLLCHLYGREEANKGALLAGFINELIAFLWEKWFRNMREVGGEKVQDSQSRKIQIQILATCSCLWLDLWFFSWICDYMPHHIGWLWGLCSVKHVVSAQDTAMTCIITIA